MNFQLYNLTLPILRLGSELVGTISSGASILYLGVHNEKHIKEIMKLNYVDRLWDANKTARRQCAAAKPVCAAQS